MTCDKRFVLYLVITRTSVPRGRYSYTLGVNPVGARERSSTSVELHCAPIRKFAFDTEDNVIDQNMLTVFAELNQF